MRLRFALLLLAVLPLGAQAQSLAEQVLELTNVARWDNGQLPPMKGSALLDSSASLHSGNMAVRDFFMHCDPDTLSTFLQRISATGYSANAAAENIAAGSSTATAVMSQWMNSSGHRTNILGDYRELGVGYFNDGNDSAPKRYGSTCTPSSSLTGNYRHYWTQNFGRSSSVYPLVMAREAWQTGTCNIDLYVYGAGFATQMRFSNTAGATWSAWQPYSANTLWGLSGVAGGVATVHGEIRNASGTVHSASDAIRLTSSCGSVPSDPSRVFGSSFEG